MFVKKILERLKSLEDYLGVAFINEDRWDTYHISKEYSEFKQIGRRLEEIEKKLDINQNKKIK